MATRPSTNPERGHTPEDRARHLETMGLPARRYWAISGIGWGRGDTPEDAQEQYVKAQRRNHQHLTRAQLIVGGELGPDLWYAPEGTESFMADHMGLHWIDAEDKWTDAQEADQVQLGTLRK